MAGRRGSPRSAAPRAFIFGVVTSVLLLLGLGVVRAQQTLPDNLILNVVANGEDLELNLYRRSVRSDDYKLRFWNSANGYHEAGYETEVRTYRGLVTSEPNQLIVGVIFPDGRATLASLTGKSYAWLLENYDVSDQLPPAAASSFIMQDPTADVLVEEFSDAAVDDFPDEEEACADGTACIVAEEADGGAEGDDGAVEQAAAKNRRTTSSSSSVLPPSHLFPPTTFGMKTAELAYDVPYYYLHAKKGGSIDYAVAQVEYYANVHDHFMSRDPMVRVVLSQVVVRIEEFYKDPLPATIGELLGRVKAEWKNSDLFDTPWDMVNCLESDTSGKIGAGLAYTNSIGKNQSPFGVKTLYHENGHNWGSQHKAYAKDTMDQNRPHQGPLNVERVIAMKQKKHEQGYLDDYDHFSYPDPLHPYAHVDAATTLVGTPVDIPVLANDWDANGDSIAIRTFTAVTANGGTVTKLAGDVLRYTPPPTYVGKDMIYYEIVDSTGLYNRDLVHIEVINRDLALHYDFDQQSSSVPGIVHDSAGHGHAGRYVGDVVPGVLGPAAARLYGTLTADPRNLLPPGIEIGTSADDYPLDPFQSLGCAFDPMAESYSLALWFRLDDVPAAGGSAHHIVRKDYQRDGVSYGFKFTVQDGRLTWTMREFYGSAPTKTGAFGPLVVAGEWTHFAMVIDRSRDVVELYLDGGTVHRTTLAAGSFIFMGRGPLRLGQDDDSDGNLSVDDVRVYYRALPSSEVRSIGVESGGKPSPHRGIFEAEDARYGGSVVASNTDGFSGSGFVNYKDDGPTAFVEWTFDAPGGGGGGGEYDISFRYALDDASGRGLAVELDGAVADAGLTFPDTGSWKTWSYTHPIRVSLGDGLHVLRASATGASGPDVDHLLVEEVVSSGNTGPRFTSDVIEMRAVPDVPMVGSLVDRALDWDAGDSLWYKKSNGPGWLTVSTDGTLGGTPGTGRIGADEFTVKVTDAAGLFDKTTLRIEVRPLPEGIVNFDGRTLVEYDAGQDKEGDATIQDYGSTVRLRGNLWKATAFQYEVTLHTVLEFDFRSSAEGEFHGIGLDADLNKSEKYIFKLYGTQGMSNDITDYENYGTEEPYTKHFVIPVGQFYTGARSYLVFINDHDTSNPTAESVFSNIKIYEQTTPVTPAPVSPPTPNPTPRPSTPQPTSLPTRDPTSSPSFLPTETPTKLPSPAPTEQPTSQPTSSPSDALDRVEDVVDLSDFVQYQSQQEFFAPDSSAYFVATDPAVGPTDRVWWGDTRATISVPMTSACLGGGGTVVASVKAQQTACGSNPWQMNAGRARNECGHSLVLTLDDASLNPWLDDYALQGCTFWNVGGGPVDFIARNWHDEDGPIGVLSLEFTLAVVPSLPLLAHVGDCTKDDKCALCTGDCDNDKHCDFGLVCKQRDGIEEVPGCAGAGESGRDYCHVPTAPDTLVIMGIAGEPASAYPLGKCQGNCDSDSECGPGLACFMRSGSETVPGCVGTPPNRVDYCYDPADAEECADHPEGWYDSDGEGFDCAWYGEEGQTHCEDFGDGYENFGYTANEACCVCGGGLPP